MVRLGFAGMGAWCAGLLLASGAQAMDCPKPSNQTESQYTAAAKVELAKLGPVSGAKVDVRVSRTSANLFAQYPHADRVVIAHAVLGAACQIIAESKGSPEEKMDLLIRATTAAEKIVR